MFNVKKNMYTITYMYTYIHQIYLFQNKSCSHTFDLEDTLDVAMDEAEDVANMPKRMDDSVSLRNI